jgi:ElaB/YqjD/DUF883 family membrane-anchored ribosome-binding protein
MARRRTRTNSRTRSIEDELETIAADVAAVGSAIGDVASTEARERIEAIRNRLDDMAAVAGDTARDGMDRVEDSIRGRPVVSVLAAFALGLATATILRR